MRGNQKIENSKSILSRRGVASKPLSSLEHFFKTSSQQKIIQYYLDHENMTEENIELMIDSLAKKAFTHKEFIFPFTEKEKELAYPAFKTSLHKLLSKQRINEFTKYLNEPPFTSLHGNYFFQVPLSFFEQEQWSEDLENYFDKTNKINIWQNVKNKAPYLDEKMKKIISDRVLDEYKNYSLTQTEKIFLVEGIFQNLKDNKHIDFQRYNYKFTPKPNVFALDKELSFYEEIPFIPKDLEDSFEKYGLTKSLEGFIKNYFKENNLISQENQEYYKAVLGNDYNNTIKEWQNFLITESLEALKEENLKPLKTRFDLYKIVNLEKRHELNIIELDSLKDLFQRKDQEANETQKTIVEKYNSYNQQIKEQIKPFVENFYLQNFNDAIYQHIKNKMPNFYMSGQLKKRELIQKLSAEDQQVHLFDNNENNFSLCGKKNNWFKPVISKEKLSLREHFVHDSCSDCDKRIDEINNFVKGENLLSKKQNQINDSVSFALQNNYSIEETLNYLQKKHVEDIKEVYENYLKGQSTVFISEKDNLNKKVDFSKFNHDRKFIDFLMEDFSNNEHSTNEDSSRWKNKYFEFFKMQ